MGAQINREMMLHNVCTPMCNVSDLTCYAICEQSHLSHLTLAELKIFGLCLRSGDVLLTLLICVFGNASGFPGIEHIHNRVKLRSRDCDGLCIPTVIVWKHCQLLSYFWIYWVCLLSMPLPWSLSPRGKWITFPGPRSLKTVRSFGLPELG